MRKIFILLFLITAVTCVFGSYEEAAADDVTIIADKIVGEIPFDPNHVVWRASHVFTIPLICQTITEPMNLDCATKRVIVSAVTNGSQIGIKVEWSDQSRNEINLRHETYRDAVAIQFPVQAVTIDDTPLYTMGEEGKTVNIWHWKSEWQKDADRRLDMEDTYPDMSADWYVDEEPGGKISYHDRQGKNLGSFDPAAYSGNIFSKIELRKSPVEDLNAEGFGSLTTQESQDVNGHGTWDTNGIWKVVFIRDLTDKDKNDVQFPAYKDIIPVAFAVWDGNNAERDGLKSISEWNYLKIK